MNHEDNLLHMEISIPLDLLRCTLCHLVQVILDTIQIPTGVWNLGMVVIHPMEDTTSNEVGTVTILVDLATTVRHHRSFGDSIHHQEAASFRLHPTTGIHQNNADTLHKGPTMDLNLLSPDLEVLKIAILGMESPNQPMELSAELSPLRLTEV